MAAVMAPDAPPRLIEGDGTPESAWQAWPLLDQCPRQPLDNWLPASSCLVVVAPHPDDELLACGALLHQHVQRGGSCLVVAVTNGEASHPPTAARSASQLADIRVRESLSGLRRLGVQQADVLRLGYPDGQLQQHVPEIVDVLRNLLVHSDVLVTTWQLDGHPDHEACGQAVAQAAEAVGCRLLQAPVWLWHWARPGDPAVPWQRLQAFEAPPESVALKLLALADHVSQLTVLESDGDGNGTSTPILGQAIQARAARATEYFFV